MDINARSLFLIDTAGSHSAGRGEEATQKLQKSKMITGRYLSAISTPPSSFLVYRKLLRAEKGFTLWDMDTFPSCHGEGGPLYSISVLLAVLFSRLAYLGKIAIRPWRLIQSRGLEKRERHGLRTESSGNDFDFLMQLQYSSLTEGE